MTRLPIGIRTCSVPCAGDLDVEDLRRLRSAGFTLAELSFNRPAQGVAHDDRHKAAALRQAARDLELTFVSHAPDLFWLSNPDRAELDRTVRAAEAVIAGAAAYGADTMVIHCCPGQALLRDDVTGPLDALIHALQALVPACERSRVRLAAETMIPGRLTSSIQHLITAVDRVGSPWVGICLDTNHLNLSQDLGDAVRQAGDRLFEFHLNDNHLVKEEHLLPYEGAIDWTALAAAMAAINYDGHLIMEPGGQYAEDGDILTKARNAAERFQEEMSGASRA